MLSHLTALFNVKSSTILMSITVATAVTAMYSLWYFPTVEEEIPSYRVAFLGNSITFVNDLPRFMEALANASTAENTRHLIQNSCLHGSLSFRSFLQKGNGMYNKWRTDNAILNVTSSRSSTKKIYDFGACSVEQLFFGYDKNLTVRNRNSAYKSDGMNPCFRESNYLYYLREKYEQKISEGRPTYWDFVVMNDQTVYPGIAKKRQRSLKVLSTKYAELFLRSQTARPVFLATYGYMKAGLRASITGQQQEQNSTDDDTLDYDSSNDDYSSLINNYDPTYGLLGNMHEFTSRIWYGYHQYATALGELLPPDQQPIIAPVGPAFLLLYEENIALWDKLFYDDGYHPSPHGSFLIGCILYATLYGRMPSSNILGAGPTLEHLWSRARRMQMPDMGESRPFPTKQEAMYLMNFADRVVLQGARPRTLLSFEAVAALEEQEAAATSVVNAYDDDY